MTDTSIHSVGLVWRRDVNIFGIFFANFQVFGAWTVLFVYEMRSLCGFCVDFEDYAMAFGVTLN